MRVVAYAVCGIRGCSGVVSWCDSGGVGGGGSEDSLM